MTSPRDIFTPLPVELSAAEWQNRPAELRSRRAFHDPSCKGCWLHGRGKHGAATCPITCEHRCGVFKCRADNADHCCGRYVGACVGGSEDNRCADCWCRLQKTLERRARRYRRALAAEMP